MHERLRIAPALRQQISRGLPTLNTLRGSSSLVDAQIAPDESLLSSPGYALEGPSDPPLGRLDATDDGAFEWVLFGFAPPEGSLVEVQFDLQGQGGIDPCFVALSDYSSGRWSLSGPFSSAESSLLLTLDLDNAVNLSAADPATAYFALVAPLGSNIALQGITVRTLQNDAPVADLLADVLAGTPPLEVSFDAGASSDPDGSITLFEFDFESDGTVDFSSAEAQAQHSFSDSGDYLVTLRVSDDEGKSSTDTLLIGVNTPPLAELQASPLVGSAPLTVDFDAGASADSDGSIVLYEFDFEDDGIYDNSGAAPGAQFTYPDTGSYTARLRVTDDDGATATDTVSIEIDNYAPVAALSLSADVASRGATVTLDASASSDVDGFIDKIEWDTDGDGTYETLAEDDFIGDPIPTLDISADTPGLFDLGVRITDNTGATDTDARPLTVQGFFDPVVVDGGPEQRGRATSMALVDGNPAISYLGIGVADAPNQYLYYTRALDAQGDTWGAPGAALDQALSENFSGNSTSLAIVNGHPAIALASRAPSDLHFIRASDSVGGAWDAPIVVASGGSDIPGVDCSLKLINGLPAIAYHTYFAQDMLYVRALDSNGASWGVPITLASDGDIGSHCSLAEINGRPAVAFYSADSSAQRGAYYLRALDAEGSDWGTMHKFAGSNSGSGQYCSLALVNGLPKASFYEELSGSMGLASQLSLAVFFSSDGDLVSYLTLDGNVNNGQFTGAFTSLAVVGAVPGVSYYDVTNQNLRFVLATDASGASWNAAVNADASASNSGEYTSLIDLGGQPAISYFDRTNSNLMYVRGYF